MPAYFTAPHGDTRLEPQPAAISGWNPDQIRGPAIAAALVRAAESLPALPGSRLARATFEFFRPTRMRTSTTESVCVRRGRRLSLIDVLLLQGGEPTARAHLLYAVAADDAPGEVWRRENALDAPPSDLAADHENRLYRAGADEWSNDSGVLRNALRKQVWQRPITIVAGEQASPDQLVAAASDLTNLVVHAGTGGIEHINADLTLTLCRRPTTAEVGVAATDRLASTGISVGSAALFDADGSLGLATLVSLSNAAHAVVLTSAAPMLTT
jgi:hypothetical protein